MDAQKENPARGSGGASEVDQLGGKVNSEDKQNVSTWQDWPASSEACLAKYGADFETIRKALGVSLDLIAGEKP